MLSLLSWLSRLVLLVEERDLEDPEEMLLERLLLRLEEALLVVERGVPIGFGFSGGAEVVSAADEVGSCRGESWTLTTNRGGATDG